MASDPGFPWQAPSEDLGKEGDTNPQQKASDVQPEQLASEEVSVIPINTAAPVVDPHQRKHSNSVHGRAHRGSLKGPPRTSYPVPAPVLDTISSKASSPLPVRTIPPWVRDALEGDVEDPQFQIPDAPDSVLVAEHHYSPSNSRRPLIHGKQNQEEALLNSNRTRAPRTSRWTSFASPSAYAHENFNTEKVDHEWLNNLTDYSKPWLADHDDDDVDDDSSRYRAFRRKRKVWYKRVQFWVLRNPFIPLMFRMVVLTFAIAAMALGASIYEEGGRIKKCIQQPPRNRSAECILRVGPNTTNYYQDPSGLMATIVDAIAIIYTVYITYDEYFSKPLGLRRARAKVRLVLLDLFFVVFQSANLALSFESLTVDEGACKTSTVPMRTSRFANLCDRAESLSSVLLVSLTAWLLTFSVSVLRLVERIETK